jgi:hypothetical protein
MKPSKAFALGTWSIFGLALGTLGVFATLLMLSGHGHFGGPYVVPYFLTIFLIFVLIAGIPTALGWIAFNIGDRLSLRRMTGRSAFWAGVTSAVVVAGLSFVVLLFSYQAGILKASTWSMAGVTLVVGEIVLSFFASLFIGRDPSALENIRSREAAVDSQKKNLLLPLIRALVIAGVPMLAAASYLLDEMRQGTALYSSNVAFAAVLAYLWFVLFLPLALLLPRTNGWRLWSLTAIGALTGGIFYWAVIYMMLGMMGHGGSGVDFHAALLDTAVFGTVGGAVSGLFFGLINRFFRSLENRDVSLQSICAI